MLRCQLSSYPAFFSSACSWTRLQTRRTRRCQLSHVMTGSRHVTDRPTTASMRWILLGHRSCCGCRLEHLVSTMISTVSNNNNSRFTALFPGLPGCAAVPEETLTHPPSRSSSNLYHLLPSTTIHRILPAQITCLAIFLHNLSPCPLWFTSWSEALHLVFHTFFSPNQCLLSTHAIPSHPVLWYQCYIIYS